MWHKFPKNLAKKYHFSFKHVKFSFPLFLILTEVKVMLLLKAKKKGGNFSFVAGMLDMFNKTYN